MKLNEKEICANELGMVLGLVGSGGFVNVLQSLLKCISIDVIWEVFITKKQKLRQNFTSKIDTPK